jgi:two-component system chemotaxis response regulator CheB
VLLSGVLDDGVVGLAAIKSRGGTTVVQQPGDALYPTMPINALQAGVADHEASAYEMGRLLMKLAEREVKEIDMDRDTQMELENRIATGSRFSTSFDTEELGPPSGYICPDCSGSLQSVSEGNFRCRVGHAWTGEALLRARDEEVERALWVAIRSLQEKSKLARRLAGNENFGRVSQRYNAVADEAEHAMEVLGSRLSEAYVESSDRDAS